MHEEHIGMSAQLRVADTHFDAKPIVSMREIHKCYGNTKILNGVSLDIMKGAAICLIGPSG
jgi:ABC-type transporter Mla maintaining outer membrane lipid asymmetry ATPase subunit MlaF